MANPLAGHTNSYHTYGFDEALAGIAEAGYGGVELSAVPGWTEHLSLDEDPAAVRRKLEGYGLDAVSLSGHSDLDDPRRARPRHQGGALGGRLRPADREHGGRRPPERRRERGRVPRQHRRTRGRRRGRRHRRRPGDPRRHHGLQRRRRFRSSRKSGGSRSRSTMTLPTSSTTRARKPSTTCRRSRATSATSTSRTRPAGKAYWNFPAIGDGSVDFGRVLEILRAAGYTGPYSVELEFTGEPWPPLDDVNEACGARTSTCKAWAS